ncbi:serine/threonine-protein kinase [Actinomadura rugatobispora]|uniref:Serine/threonine-protein kinase n=1 Tax=Actinomadura rugatobispora TaxID=1994 RepID=A0ABW1AFG7_9ACTN|nr:hypothetical protein GCM10010200_057230 [Actinomadura rugatobispora]
MQEDRQGEGLPAGTRPLGTGDPAAIGPYPLLGMLGQGGMGAVYLGTDRDGRQVAIKVIRPELAADETYLARFHDEVRHARQVASFCTAAVLDHGEDGGRPYLVTEYVEGAPLSEHIRRHGALPSGTLHGVAVGVAAALTAIHSVGLVHRDLKPANVVLSISGPRVIDFGIARGVGERSGHTRSGSVVGSPGWISPEQVRTGEVSPAGDVFAWGCLVAFAGTGRHPFGGADERSAGDPLVMAYRAQQHLYDLGDLADPLRTLVSRALAPEPVMRPTAQQLLLALVGGSPAAAQPGGGPAGGADPAGARPGTGRVGAVSVGPIGPRSSGGPGGAGGAGGPGWPEGPEGPGGQDADPPPFDILAAASHSVDANWRLEDLPLWTPPSEPLPPPPPAPPVDPKVLRRVRINLWVRRAVTFLVLAAAAIGGLAYYQDRNEPVTAEFGRPAKDGDLSFEAKAPECGVKVKGVTARDGKLCQVRFTVTNTSVSAQVLDPASQRLLDASENEHGAVMLFRGTPGPKTKVSVQSLQSADSFTGVLLYDVPPGFVPRALELHASGSSKGVRLSL